MPTPLNAYDTGYRLEPKPWPTGPDVQPDNYGRVDFDDDESATLLTVRIQKTEAGYIARVDEHTDVPLTIETSTQRQEREVAMQHLDQQLNVISKKHFEQPLEYEDPDTFGAGHFTITSEGGDRRVAITEQYIGTDSSDPDRIPNSWELRIETHDRRDGWKLQESSEYGPDEVQQLVDRVETWAQDSVREWNTREALQAQQRQQTHQMQSPAPGITM